MSNRIHIALFPDRIAHYRVPIFKTLAEQPELDITFFFSPKPSVQTISQRLPSEFGLKGSMIKELVIKERVFWQTKVIGAVANPKYDIIVCWGEAHRISTWIATLLSIYIRKPMIMWTHGIYGNEGKLKLLTRFVFYGLSSHLLLYGERAKRILSKIIPKQRLSVIYNALDYELQKAIRDKITPSELSELKHELFRSNAKCRTIIYTGRLTHVKKLNQLIELIKILEENDPQQYALIIVGDGPARKDLMEKSKKLDLSSSINFLGPCYEETELAKLFLISDLCICPANIGLTALHALAYGTAVASHSNMNLQKPESECIHTGKNGFLFKEDNIHDMALKTREWFIKEVPRNQIIQYSDQHIFNKYTTVYQSKIFTKTILESISNAKVAI